MARLPVTLNNGAVGDARIDWERMFAEHGRWLRTVVRSRLQEPELVEDVIQEVFLAASRSHLQPDPDKVAPWLYRVAIKQCLQARRKLGRYRRLVDGYARQGVLPERTESCSPLSWLMNEEQRVSIHEALNQLSDLDREILLLKHTEGWSYRDLAKYLGVTVNTVEYRLLQAKKNLRNALVAEGVGAPT